MEMVINVAVIATLSFGVWLLYTVSEAACLPSADRMANDES